MCAAGVSQSHVRERKLRERKRKEEGGKEERKESGFEKERASAVKSELPQTQKPR